MHCLWTAIALFALVLSTGQPARSFNIAFSDSAAPRSIKWPTNRIKIAFSTSLLTPGINIKQGSDVIGAAQRALSRWCDVTSIRFSETLSATQSISSGVAGDGVSLITIADTPENNVMFAGGRMTGRTRVFYDEATGEITEADVAINPHPVSADGLPLQFSTDGSPGTYDLESTFTHELGHLLGLDHSAVLAATMQAHQALNNIYKPASFSERTLGEDDRAKVASIYGPRGNLGSIEGRLLGSSPAGSVISVSRAHVWAEDISSGRLIGSTTSTVDGRYRIASIPAGLYRVMTEDLSGSIGDPQGVSAAGIYNLLETEHRAFRSTEIASQLLVEAGRASKASFIFVPPQNSSPTLSPRLIGINRELSDTAIAAEAGKRVTIYVAGPGVDQVPGNGISIGSPNFTVEPASLTLQAFALPFPVVSFDVVVAHNVSFGDYSIRLQLNSGETAYVAGGITVDPGTETTFANADDDPSFFVAHHYRDFLGREPDQQGFDRWINELTPCGSDLECLHKRRLAISEDFSTTAEFQETSFFIYGLYRAAFNRRPTFAEFLADRQTLAGSSSSSAKQGLSLTFTERASFLRAYPSSMNAEHFVDTLLSRISNSSQRVLSLERRNLLKLYDGTSMGQSVILRRVVDDPAFRQSEYNEAFVLMQYFGYLKRDPDTLGYNSWVSSLNKRMSYDKTAYRTVACAFATSAEYQLRFGMVLTHNSSECLQ